jgi:hypothetical protein
MTNFPLRSKRNPNVLPVTLKDLLVGDQPSGSTSRSINVSKQLIF